MIYWSQNSCRLVLWKAAAGWPSNLMPVWACQCERWVWEPGRASSPCISSSCHYAAAGEPSRQSPATEGGEKKMWKKTEQINSSNDGSYWKYTENLNGHFLKPLWKLCWIERVNPSSLLSTHVFSEEVSVWSQNWVNISDIVHDVLHCPQVGVLTTRLWALLKIAGASRSTKRKPDIYYYILFVAIMYNLNNNCYW